MNRLEKRLGYEFKDRDILKQALTHPSKGYESKKKVSDNQRMEFLGDAVLQLALTIRLYQKFPEMDEGQLTKLRAQMVNRTMLERIALSFGVGEFLILGRGEELNHGRTRASNLADAMEAIIGGVFQDAGFEVAHQWIINILEPYFEETLETSTLANPKGELQEVLQAEGKGTPIYETLEESGPDHARHYSVAVKLGNEELGRGEGASKRAAETQAALHALNALRKN
ncbi:MAG: ribonuclease III [Verrucomicrobiota bacterium]